MLVNLLSVSGAYLTAEAASINEGDASKVLHECDYDDPESCDEECGGPQAALPCDTEVNDAGESYLKCFCSPERLSL